MATPATTAAALAQNRHQGGLREYVNQKLAPYVKKALKDVCDVDAEYPLQWLGEHLINQSLLYENNPDTTGIKERFFYNFDEPQSSARSPTAAAAAAEDTLANNVIDTSTSGTQLPNTSNAAPEELTPQLYNGDHLGAAQMVGTDQVYDTREQIDIRQEHSNDDTNIDMLNGVTEIAREESGAEHVNGDREGAVDTEMAGTA